MVMANYCAKGILNFLAIEALIFAVLAYNSFSAIIGIRKVLLPRQ